MKIWAKTMLGDKIVKDCLHEKIGRSSRNLLESAMREICELFDVPCPLILISHYENFCTFNITKFAPSDFVESVDFDLLVIENVTD